MPRYELALISRIMSKDVRMEYNGETLGYAVVSFQASFAAMLRRTALSILDKGGVVRKMENLGAQELPYRMRAHAEWHTHGRYFLFDVELSPDGITELRNELRMDSDLIRPRIVKIQSRYDSMPYTHSELECWKNYKKP